MAKFTVEIDLDMDDYVNDPDAVRNDVKAHIVREVASRCHIPWITDADARKEMREAVKAEITMIVREVVESEVRQIADSEFTPTNKWGEKTGDPVTLRGMVADAARTWFSEPTDERGNVGYAANGPKRPRIEWKILGLISEVFKAEAATTVEAVKNEVRAGVQRKIGAEIASAVAKLLQP